MQYKFYIPASEVEKLSCYFTIKKDVLSDKFYIELSATELAELQKLLNKN